MQQTITRIVKDMYRKYGHENVAVTVTVQADNATITINTENPFLNEKFFSFLEDLTSALEEKGYSKKEGSFFGDFYFLEVVAK